MSAADLMRARDAGPQDAAGIGALFRAAYGPFYTYPQVYLPSRLRQLQASGAWRSVVVARQGQVLGHAALRRRADAPELAELALVAVHPQARGQGLASLLGRRLLELALDLNLAMLSMQQVCSHPRSRHLARALGFQTTAWLPGHVPSPFGAAEPESLVLGCLALWPRPLPALDWPAAWAAWLDPLRRRWGEMASPAPRSEGGLAVARQGRRVELQLRTCGASALDEVLALPASLPVLLQLPASAGALTQAPRLQAAGFCPAGLMPCAGGGWQLLWSRGAPQATPPEDDPVVWHLHRLTHAAAPAAADPTPLSDPAG